MNTIKIACDICGKDFDRSLAEYTRTKRLGRHSFCSRSCCVKYTHLASPRKGNVDNLVLGSEVDELSSFRWFANKINSRCNEKRSVKKGMTSSLTPEALKERWEKQSGICPYTGWLLELPRTSKGYHVDQTRTKRASVDRIDCFGNYEIDNIQFVSQMANLAKNNFTDADLIEFCKAVALSH